MDLIRSAIDGQVFELEKMLGVKDFRVNECDASKMTALHYAAWYNKTEVVAALLENNAGNNALSATYTSAGPDFINFHRSKCQGCESVDSSSFRSKI